MAEKKRYYHYTTLDRVKAILETGAIKRATASVPKGVKPVAWFSTNENWEITIFKVIVNSKTGNKIDLYTKDDYLRHGLPPARIEVNPEVAELRGWNNYKKNSGDDNRLIRGLERTAREAGANPKTWFVSYGDVSIDCFLSIEVWNGSAWIDLKNLDEKEQIRLQQSE